MEQNPARPSTPAHKRSRRSLLTIELLVLSALLSTWLVSRHPAAPSVRWQFGETRTIAEPFSTLPPGFPLRLEVELPRPMYLYVASHDALRGNIALWPSTTLKSDQAPELLPAGKHVLPGRWREKDVVWHAGDGVGATTFMVIASETPIADLATAMAKFRQMGNAAFPDRTTCATYAPAGGMKEVPARTSIADPILRQCATATDGAHDGPMEPVPDRAQTWMKAMHVITPLPEEPLDESAVQRELAERFGPLEKMLEIKGSPADGQKTETPPTTGR